MKELYNISAIKVKSKLYDITKVFYTFKKAMDWLKLRTNQCPSCNKRLENFKDDAMLCPCGFSMRIAEIKKIISGEVIPAKERLDIEKTLDKIEARRVAKEKFREGFISRNPDKDEDNQ